MSRTESWGQGDSSGDSFGILDNKYYEKWNHGGIIEVSHMLEEASVLSAPKVRSLVTKNPLTVLLVGSATPRNVSHVRNFLSFARKTEQPSEDRIVLMDKNLHAIEIHKKKMSRGASVVPMDMTAMGFKENAFDLLISDQTLNFSRDLSSVGDALAEFSYVLSPQGLGLVAFAAPLEDHEGIQHGLMRETVTGMKRLIPTPFRLVVANLVLLPLGSVAEAAEKAGLSLEVLLDDKKPMSATPHRRCITMLYKNQVKDDLSIE